MLKSLVDSTTEGSNLSNEETKKPSTFQENELIEKSEDELELEKEVTSNKLHPSKYLVGEPMQAVNELLRISKKYSDRESMDSLYLETLESDVCELAAWLVRGSAVLGECTARTHAIEEVYREVKGQLAEKIRDSYDQDLRPSAKTPTDKTIEYNLEASTRLSELRKLKAESERAANTLRLVLASGEQLINALKKRIEGIRIEYRSTI